MDSGAGVRIRRMELADVDQVMEIAESLPEAPHWPAAAYLAARMTVTALNQSITASDEGDGTSEQLTGLIETNADDLTQALATA